MPSYKPGDVVLVHFPWKNPQGQIEMKVRPGLILSEDSHEEWIVIQITSKNRSHQLPGKWILHRSELGRKMGIRSDSFISYSKRKSLNRHHIIRKIDFYELIDEIIDDLDAP